MLDAIRVVPQRFQDDCGIACLSMILVKPYEAIYDAMRHHTKKKSHRGGLTLKQIEAIAASFGVILVRQKRYDLDEAIGILSISGKNYEHVVVVKKGTIIDPSDGTVWDADTYLAHHNFRAHTLLTFSTLIDSKATGV
jgi:ABC-type bacteriocin/lantibiotic exporter with double-glycine peptidase domain